MDLMTRRRAMMQAAAGGEPGVLDLPWITSREKVTIGANSVTNMAQAIEYFSAYSPYFIVVLRSAPTTNNQVVALGRPMRYRNGAISQTGTASNYDGVLVEGTEYDIYFC